jgi:hypothetical protein
MDFTVDMRYGIVAASIVKNSVMCEVTSYRDVGGSYSKQKHFTYTNVTKNLFNGFLRRACQYNRII